MASNGPMLKDFGANIRWSLMVSMTILTGCSLCKIQAVVHLTGNFDANVQVKRDFVPPLFARYIKIMTIAWHNQAALRIEVCTNSPLFFNFVLNT